MTDLHDPELDREIRRAVAELTAAAPIARSFDELEELAEAPLHTGPSRVRWVAAGVLVAATIAAAITVWRVGADDRRDGVVTVATDPPVTTAAAVTTSAASAPPPAEVYPVFDVPDGLMLWAVTPGPAGETSVVSADGRFEQLFSTSRVRGPGERRITVSGGSALEGPVGVPDVEVAVRRTTGYVFTVGQPEYGVERHQVLMWFEHEQWLSATWVGESLDAVVSFLDALVWSADPHGGFDGAPAGSDLVPRWDRGVDIHSASYVLMPTGISPPGGADVGVPLEIGSCSGCRTTVWDEGVDIGDGIVFVAGDRNWQALLADGTSAAVSNLTDGELAKALFRSISRGSPTDLRRLADEASLNWSSLPISGSQQVGEFSVETHSDVEDGIKALCLTDAASTTCARVSKVSPSSTMIRVGDRSLLVGVNDPGVDDRLAASFGVLEVSTAVSDGKVWWWGELPPNSAPSLVWSVADPSIGFQAPACCDERVPSGTPGESPVQATPDVLVTRAGTTVVLDVLANDQIVVDSSFRLEIAELDPDSDFTVTRTGNRVTLTVPADSPAGWTFFSYGISNDAGDGVATVSIDVRPVDG